MAKTFDEHKRFIELRAKGLSYAKIADEMKINKNTCIELSKQYELEIFNRKQIELEALREEFFLLKKQKILILSEQLQKIREQIKSRDFSEIDTKDLIKLQSDLIKEIEIELRRDGMYLKQKNNHSGIDFSNIETWRA